MYNFHQLCIKVTTYVARFNWKVKVQQKIAGNLYIRHCNKKLTETPYRKPHRHDDLYIYNKNKLQNFTYQDMMSVHAPLLIIFYLYCSLRYMIKLLNNNPVLLYFD